MIEYCWIDIETTGLSAALDVPLEIGLILTDELGTELAAKKWLVWENDSEEFQDGVTRGRENEFVDAMHNKSGLWHDLKVFADISKTRDEVDYEMVRWLTDNEVPGDKSIPLAGSSIGSLDRPFVLVHFPKLNGFLSYRNVDTSSVREICKRVNPSLYENLLPALGMKEDSLHRVLDDARASINEYKLYLENFFFTEESDD